MVPWWSSRTTIYWKWLRFRHLAATCVPVFVDASVDVQSRQRFGLGRCSVFLRFACLQSTYFLNELARWHDSLSNLYNLPIPKIGSYWSFKHWLLAIPSQAVQFLREIALIARRFHLEIPSFQSIPKNKNKESPFQILNGPRPIDNGSQLAACWGEQSFCRGQIAWFPDLFFLGCSRWYFS